MSLADVINGLYDAWDQMVDQISKNIHACQVEHAMRMQHSMDDLKNSFKEAGKKEIVFFGLSATK